MTETRFSKRLLIIGFSALIAILLLIAIIGITQMQKAIEHAEHMTGQRITKIGHALQMRDITMRRINIMRTAILSDDPFERDEMLLEFRLIPVEFIKHRDAFKSLISEDMEGQLLDSISKNATDNYWAEDKIINLISDDEIEAARRVLVDEQLETMAHMLKSVRDMVDYQQTSFRRDMAQNHELHVESNYWLAILFLSGLLLSILIAVAVMYRFNVFEREQRKSMKALIESRDAAERANQSKTEFLSSMSHELRTPLNAVIGFSQLLKEEELTEDQEENVDIITSSGQHLLEVINEILDLSRIESGKTSIQYEVITLDSIFSSCEQMVNNLLQEYEVSLTMPADTINWKDINISADKTRFKQVMLNIISNAIKYNRRGGSVDIQVSQPEQHRVRISIQDSGVGIPFEKQERLFNSFDRLGREAGTIEGSGIGLVISKRLIEKMGGSIGFKSMPEQGSTFWVEMQEAESRENQ